MIFVERRRAGFTADLFWRVGLVWLVVSAIFVVVRWSAIAGMQLPMPMTACDWSSCAT